MTDMKIEVGKKYRTRGGKVVLIDRAGGAKPELADDEFWQFSGEHPEAGPMGWRGDGVFYMFGESVHDLIEEVIEKVKADGARDLETEMLAAAEHIVSRPFPPPRYQELNASPYAAALAPVLDDMLRPGGPLHYAPPAIEPTDLLAALRMLLREVDAGTSGGRIRIDGSAALIDAATLARSVIQRHAP